MLVHFSVNGFGCISQGLEMRFRNCMFMFRELVQKYILGDYKIQIFNAKKKKAKYLILYYFHKRYNIANIA